MGRTRTLSRSKVLKAFQLRGEGFSFSQIAETIGTTRQFVHQLLLRKSYAHYEIPQHMIDEAAKFNDKVQEGIAMRDAMISVRVASGLSYAEVAEQCLCSVATVCRTMKKMK